MVFPDTDAFLHVSVLAVYEQVGGDVKWRSRQLPVKFREHHLFLTINGQFGVFFPAGSMRTAWRSPLQLLERTLESRRDLSQEETFHVCQKSINCEFCGQFSQNRRGCSRKKTGDADLIDGVDVQNAGSLSTGWVPAAVAALLGMSDGDTAMYHPSDWLRSDPRYVMHAR